MRGRVENAVEQMSQMISEILYQDKTTVVPVSRVLRRVSAQLSIEDYAPFVHMEAEDPEAKVRVNSILFSRVLVNLVQNAARAVENTQSPSITVRSDVSEGWVRFQVTDNGRGIPEQRLKEIWGRGYSGSDSSGLGLFFVRDVVERLGGHVDLQSTEGTGTSITICILKEE